MNNIILARNSLCDSPLTGVGGSQADKHSAISHKCKTALRTGYCASCSGSKLRAQQYTASCDW